MATRMERGCRKAFSYSHSPLFADYIVFGALQWARVSSPYSLLDHDDPIDEWFRRCLGLFGGLGAGVPAAA